MYKLHTILLLLIKQLSKLDMTCEKKEYRYFCRTLLLLLLFISMSLTMRPN